MYSYNLADRPWIPCVMLDGELAELSLKEILTSAHRVREVFDPSPLITAALYRLLLAVFERVYAPENLSAWKLLWQNGRLDEERIAQYLEERHDCFDLFHPERPFYQRAHFETKNIIPLKRLGFEFAAGNNATLFDHSFDAERPDISPALAARWVVSTQTFAASAGNSETSYTKDSPWTRGAVILMQGDNLFQTLLLNSLSLLTPGFPSFADDCVSWESNAHWQPAHGLTPSGKLSYLTWQSRSIRLIPVDGGSVKECYFAQGQALDEDWRSEPMYAYRRDPKLGMLVWKFDENRAVWRDSHALFNLSHDAPFKLPDAIAHIASLIREGFLERHRLYQLVVLGQCLESGKPTIHFWRQERLPLQAEYLNDSALLAELKKALDLAESCGRALHQNLWTLAKLLIATNSDRKEARQPAKSDVGAFADSFGALPYYWAQLESPFKRLLLDLPSDSTTNEGEVSYGEREMPKWSLMLYRISKSALLSTTRGLDESARALKAVARVEPAFERKLREILSDFMEPVKAKKR
jgi:CRISPR system Cascade subunit CasA